MTEEHWMSVVGYENDYEVSDFGRVRSRTRIRTNSKATRVWPSKILKQRRIKESGRMEVRLWKDGEAKHHFVHVLVLSAFVGPRPTGLDGCHNDGKPANNNLLNLRWDTKRANQADRLRHGTSQRGKPLKRRTYLSNDRVAAVRADPRPIGQIAADYGVCVQTVRKLKAGFVRQDRW